LKIHNTLSEIKKYYNWWSNADFYLENTGCFNKESGNDGSKKSTGGVKEGGNNNSMYDTAGGKAKDWLARSCPCELCHLT
jgi:hypothetical protein